jgi:hypothetical protein
MDLLSPLRFSMQVTAGILKLWVAVPRAFLKAAFGDEDGDTFTPTAHQVGTPTEAAPSPMHYPSRPAPGAAARRRARPTGGRATPRRAKTPDESVEVSAAPPEPTSAAGASGGVAGTAEAPTDAATAGAPDPTAATTEEARPVAPTRERTVNQTQATPAPREKTVDDTPELAETEGAATPSAEIRVDAPWEGYDEMKAADVVDRLKAADDAQKAVVRLYEQQHKKRKSVLDAAS